MRDDELRAYVARTRAAQGLPPKVEDPTTLQRIADLMRATPGDEPHERAS